MSAFSNPLRPHSSTTSIPVRSANALRLQEREMCVWNDAPSEARAARNRIKNILSVVRPIF